MKNLLILIRSSRKHKQQSKFVLNSIFVTFLIQNVCNILKDFLRNKPCCVDHKNHSSISENLLNGDGTLVIQVLGSDLSHYLYSVMPCSSLLSSPLPSPVSPAAGHSLASKLGNSVQVSPENRSALERFWQAGSSQ